jgi:hypothetical protein
VLVVVLDNLHIEDDDEDEDENVVAARPLSFRDKRFSAVARNGR